MAFFPKNIYYSQFSKYKNLYQNIYQLTGFWPKHHRVYKQAFVHNSLATPLVHSKINSSNERLEFLGDAVLDLVLATFLFKKFPFESEGFLTEMRSKAVSRKSLSEISRKMGLTSFLYFDKNIKNNDAAISGISGNALEALVGAVYLDLGFEKCKQFIVHKIIKIYLDFDELKNQIDNFKSLLNQYCQKERKKLHFEVLNESGKNHKRTYTMAVVIDEEIMGQGKGISKKTAEQIAAHLACKKLGLVEG